MYDIEILIKTLQLIASSARCKKSNANWLAIHFSVQCPKVLANQNRFFSLATFQFCLFQLNMLVRSIDSERWFRSCCAISLHKRKPIRNNWHWWIYTNSRLFHFLDQFSNSKSNWKIIMRNPGQANWRNSPTEKYGNSLFQFEYSILFEVRDMEMDTGIISTMAFPCISISIHWENLKNTSKTNLLTLI